MIIEKRIHAGTYASLVPNSCENGLANMAPWMELPYSIEDCTMEEEKAMKKCLLGYTKNFVKCGKQKYIMPGAFKKHAEAIYNMEVRPDDIWVITYPRSGTTWTQEMVWLLENNLDYAASRKTPLYERFPMVELTSVCPDLAFELIKKTNFLNLSNFQGLGSAVRYPSWKTVEECKSPRFIKTHLPLSLLPPNLVNKAKVVYVARDPRDALVSYYYMHKMVGKSLLKATIPDFWELFRKDLLLWTPIVAHANEAWTLRHHPNMHFIFYEDLIKDLPNEVNRMCQFLNRDYSDEELAKLSQYLTFDSLKKNKSVNNPLSEGRDDAIQFIRKGQAGGWRSIFDEKMQLQAEEFLTERLKGLTLSYPSFQLHETTHL